MIKLAVTMRDIQRCKVLAEVIDKKLSLKDAAEVLALSYRQAIRLKQDCQEHGLEGILRRNPAYPPNKKLLQGKKGGEGVYNLAVSKRCT